MEYEIHTWNDEAYYELILLGESYYISFKKDGSGSHLLWDIEGSKSKVYCDETLTIDISDVWSAEITTDKMTTEKFKIKFVRKNNS